MLSGRQQTNMLLWLLNASFQRGQYLQIQKYYPCGDNAGCMSEGFVSIKALLIWQIIKKKLKKDVEQCVRKSRNDLYRNGLSKSKGNKRETFKLLNNMLGKRDRNTLPDFTSEKELCNDFETYFVSKVSNVRNSITCNSSHINNATNSTVTPQEAKNSFGSFSTLTEKNLLDVLSSLTNKHCELDIIPTPLFKKCSKQLMPYLLYMINTSLLSGKFPTCFKTSLVKPILKNASYDRNTMSNYRPISNMCFLSKVMEKCVLNQL